MAGYEKYWHRRKLINLTYRKMESAVKVDKDLPLSEWFMTEVGKNRQEYILSSYLFIVILEIM